MELGVRRARESERSWRWPEERLEPVVLVSIQVRQGGDTRGGVNREQGVWDMVRHNRSLHRGPYPYDGAVAVHIVIVTIPPESIGWEVKLPPSLCQSHAQVTRLEYRIVVSQVATALCDRTCGEATAQCTLS